MIQAFHNQIYQEKARKVGAPAPLAELSHRLQTVQRSLRCPVLSAKHIGLDLAVFALDLNFAGRDSMDLKLILVNPEITATRAPLVSGLEQDVCLPGLSISIERPKHIEVRFSNEQLEPQESTFSDLAARWVHHGIDRLDGLSIIDRINHHRQRSVKWYLNKMAKGKVETPYPLIHEEAGSVKK